MNTVKVLNPLKALQQFGQSIWFDYVRRNLLVSGELTRLINDDGLRGMTSNPSIFEKAIAGSTDYDETLRKLVKENSQPKDLYEKLAIEDIQLATDLMKPVYDETKGRDGYVSLEVSPKLANDTEGTIEEARRLWKTVNRPNVMIKVPGTEAGLPAIEKLISEGININITLLFYQETYERVADAFIKGLETFKKNGGDVSKVASVASFFVSRIDTLIDSTLEKKIADINDPKEQALLKGLLGKVAIANAKMAYQAYKRIFAEDRWQALAKSGAKTQRLLWASTGTKNPKYSDTLYVDELIGPDTVNTVPPATYEAYKDHGKPSATLEQGAKEAQQVMEDLKKTGISMKESCDKLVVDGVKLFADAFDQLLEALATKRKTLAAAHLDTISYHLDKKLTEAVHAALDDWRKNDKIRRLWARDASLWTNKDESKWLGWLDITYDQLAHITPLEVFADEIKKAGYKHALLLGMGGSSLGPEVLAKTFGNAKGFPELIILDSTDPAQVLETEKRIALDKTIFIVSSKSGSTLEPNVFKQYFFEKVKEKLGPQEAGKRFIAITDPGSKMEEVAKRDGFKHIFHGLPSIGGRYSVLSNFGIVPAAVIGMDLSKFLNKTDLMVHACAAAVPPENNPGVLLGAVMGVLHNAGRDKVTLIVSPPIGDLAAWLEQLLAESTGKNGKGLIPIENEPTGTPAVAGNDRLFVYVRLHTKPDAAQDKAVDELEAAGQPIVRISVEDIDDLGQEFFRWEIATAVAGAIIGINAFDQPDVEASKVATRNLTSEYEKTGKLPAETPFFEGDGFKLFSDQTNAEAIKKGAGASKSLSDYLKAHFARVKAGDYCALLAYLQMNDKHASILQEIRRSLRDTKKVATCLGFGPRFLHSTGQAYKGGPNTGVFLQITVDDAQDVPIPEQKYTFGIVKAAQARGDFEVLAQRSRRALRVHITGSVETGLQKLKEAVQQALK